MTGHRNPGLEALLDTYKRECKYAGAGTIEDSRAREAAARSALLAAVEKVEAERDEARKRADEEDAWGDEAMKERDRRENEIAAIASALGCEEEWTNAHDHGECALELAHEWRERAEKAEAAVAAAREEAAMVADGWAAQYPPDVFASDGPEGKAGKMARHVATKIAEDIRSLSPSPSPRGEEGLRAEVERIAEKVSAYRARPMTWEAGVLADIEAALRAALSRGANDAKREG